MVTSLSWPWCSLNPGRQLQVRAEEHLKESSISSAAIGVCAGWMCVCVQMCHKKGSRSRSVKDANDLGSRSRLGVDQIQEKFCPCPVACPPFHRAWGRLPKRNVAKTSLRCHCNFWIPQDGVWRGFSGFSREENITIFEACSILCAVWCGEQMSRRFLMLSAILRCKSFKTFYNAFSCAS